MKSLCKENLMKKNWSNSNGCFGFLTKQRINTKLDTLANEVQNEDADQIVLTFSSNFDKSDKKEDFNNHF